MDELNEPLFEWDGRCPITSFIIQETRTVKEFINGKMVEKKEFLYNKTKRESYGIKKKQVQPRV